MNNTEQHRPEDHVLLAGPPNGLSTLIIRNVQLPSKRTSLRLERSMWDALEEICRREDCSLGELAERINGRRRESTLTAAMRVYALSYFRIAATEDGHAAAGHGDLTTSKN